MPPKFKNIRLSFSSVKKKINKIKPNSNNKCLCYIRITRFRHVNLMVQNKLTLEPVLLRYSIIRFQVIVVVHHEHTQLQIHLFYMEFLARKRHIFHYVFFVLNIMIT